MRLLKDQGIPFEYHIAGWGDPTAVKFHIADQKLEGEVKLYYKLSHTEVFETLKGMDALLIASVEEGFATVATEAMAVGVPLITTDCGGMAELIKHKTHGWLIPQRDPKAIAEAVKDLKSSSEDELTRLTTNAKNLVKDRLIWEDQIHQYEQLYRQSLNRKWSKRKDLLSA
jgi:colanic acid/amylovoran biosynthesis glycosyltransferase